MHSILAHFDALTDQGLKVIPIRENSKVPLCKGWTKNWDRDYMRCKLQQFPDSNIGVLLGDIIDVEGDSEKANETIIGLIKDYPHPVYRSFRSIHHLFVTPDPTLRLFRWQNIEFRGHGHQSVLPPSQTGGIVYRWQKGMKFPVPPMPEELVEFLNKKRDRRTKSKKNVLKAGHVAAYCSVCNKKSFLHIKRWHLEVKAFKLLSRKWECRECRTFDMRPACRIIRAGAPDNVVAEKFQLNSQLS